MPISSLRSRIQEQRAKDKLVAQSSTRSMPIFYTPVKPDPITVSIPNVKKVESPIKKVVDENVETTDIDSRYEEGAEGSEKEAKGSKEGAGGSKGGRAEGSRGGERVKMHLCILEL